MKTINVRILVRNDVDEDLAVDQLVRGVLRVNGAVELIRNDAGQLVPSSSVHHKSHIVWNGQESGK